MNELIDFSFQGGNIFPTALLLFVGLYWVIFLVGLLDLSFLDFDLDVDKELSIDIDVDAEVDVDVDADAETSNSGHGLGVGFLRFINLDVVPFMAFLTFFALFFWGGSVIGNYYYSDGSTLGSLAVAGVSIVIALLMSKIITQPFRAFFKSLHEEEKPIEFRGRICVLEVGVIGTQLGQAEITVDGKNILLTVLSETGHQVQRGTKCVIVDYVEPRNAYTVHPLNLETE